MKISKSGYKKNSKDKNEESLLIPTNEITMENVQFPVLGISDTGDVRIMNPGEEHVFNGNYVYELPMAQDGGYILPGRYRNPEGNWVSKYASGGDISIPDLSNKGWLSKYQTGGVHQRIYTDPLEFEEANRAYNDSLVLHDNTKNMINDLVYLDNIYKNNPNILADKWLDYSIEWYKSKGPKVDLPYNRLTQKNKKAPEPSKTYKSKVDPNQVAVEYKKPTEEPKLDQQAVIQQISKDYPGYSIKFEKDKIFIREPETEYMIDNGIHNIWQPLPTKKPKVKLIQSKAFTGFDRPEQELKSSTTKIGSTKTKPIMRSAQDTKTGQYQIGYNYWDDKSKSWKQKMFSKETQQENYDDVKIPRKKTIKVPPQFQNGGWLSKYQDAGPVQRDPNVLMYPSVSGESDTFDAAYSLPTVNVTPKWTEAELERNRLRDDYIKKDKNAFRHWYDKLGYDRRNVDKRAMQYAYNKLAKEYLKGDRDKLTDEQKKFIGKSEYAARLQPTVGERFVEGVTNPGFNLETLGNIAAPLEYPTNLVRGAVKGEFTDAVKGYTPSPYFVSSDLAGTSPTEAAIMSGIIDAGVDSGLGAIGELNLADDAARATKKANNFLLSKQGTFYKPKLGTLPVDISPEQIRKLAEIDEASSINAYTHRPNDINLTYEEINNIGEYRKNEAIKRFLERSRYLNEEEVVQIFGKTKQEILNYKPNIPTNSSAPISPSSPITTMMDRILRFGDPQIERAFTDILTSSNRFQAEEAINTISSPMWRDRLREYAATYYPEMNQVDNSAQNINQVLSPPETIYVDLNSNNITDGYQSGSYAAQRAAEELPSPPPELNSLFSTNNVENIYDTYRRSSNDIFSTRPQNNLSANWQNTPSSWANFYTQQQPLSLTGELRKIPKNIKGLFNAAAKNPDHIATPSLYAMSYSTPKEMLIDVTDKLNKSVLDAKPGEIITGSTNTSYNSYLVQMDYVAKNAGKGDLSEPIFLGYKPMNNSGFLSNMGVPNEEIIQYINNNLNKIQTRKGVNFNFGNNAPYIGKDGNIMIPHFGLRKITPQGEFSGIKKKHGGWLHKYQDGGDYNMQRALELGYTPDETGHWPSVDSETGMWLKSKEHPTAWTEYLYGYTLNPELNKTTNVVINPEGYFGENQLQYVRKYKKGGVKSQVEPDGRKMAENLKRIWNLSQPSFTRPSSYDEYTPKFGWSRGSMTPEERAYEQEYLRQKYSPIPYLYIDPYELQTIDYLQNLLFSKPKKKGGVKSSGEGYYDYINGY